MRPGATTCAVGETLPGAAAFTTGPPDAAITSKNVPNSSANSLRHSRPGSSDAGPRSSKENRARRRRFMRDSHPFDSQGVNDHARTRCVLIGEHLLLSIGDTRDSARLVSQNEAPREFPPVVSYLRLPSRGSIWHVHPSSTLA